MASYPNAVSLQPSLPIRSGHQIHNQQNGGSARVHNGDVINNYTGTFVLSEDVSKEVAGLSSLMANAETTCKTLYSLINTTQNCPDHVYNVSRELEDLHLVLGTLQALLSDDESAESVVWSSLPDNLAKAIQDCISIFEDIRVRLGELDPGDEERKTGKEPSRNGLSMPEVITLQNKLIAHKITLNIAVSMTTLYHLNLTKQAISEFRGELKLLLENLEDEKAAKLPQAEPHRDIDRSTVKVDYAFAIRRYVHDTASFFSENTVRPAPSMQLSSYLGSDASGTVDTFYTTQAYHVLERCTQIFIRGILGSKTMVLQVEPLHTIASVKRKIRDRLDLPYAAFQLVYAGHVLANPTSTIEGYNISHDSTLLCVSFRPDELQPGTWFPERILSVIIESRGDSKSIKLDLDTDRTVLVQDVIRQYAIEGGSYNVDLIHVGRKLSRDLPLTTNLFLVVDGYVKLYAIPTLVHYSRIRRPLFPIDETSSTSDSENESINSTVLDKTPDSKLAEEEVKQTEKRRGPRRKLGLKLMLAQISNAFALKNRYTVRDTQSGSNVYY